MTIPVDSASIVLAAIGPFVCCWLMVKWVLDVSRFLNGLRDSIMSGHIGGVPVDREHRWVLTWDWMISLTGTFLSLVAFNVLLSFSADAVASLDLGAVPVARAFGVALSSLAKMALVAAGGVLLCALMDLRGIWRAMKSAT